MKRNRIALPAAVGVAAVWFGSHAGGGFATGRQEVVVFCTVWVAFDLDRAVVYADHGNCHI